MNSRVLRPGHSHHSNARTWKIIPNSSCSIDRRPHQPFKYAREIFSSFRIKRGDREKQSSIKTNTDQAVYSLGPRTKSLQPLGQPQLHAVTRTTRSFHKKVVILRTEKRPAFALTSPLVHKIDLVSRKHFRPKPSFLSPGPAEFHLTSLGAVAQVSIGVSAR